MDLKLQYFYKNIVYPVSVGFSKSHYMIEDSETTEYFYENKLRGMYHGVRWEYKGQMISLFEHDVTIMAYPSVDIKYIVAVYGNNSQLYPPPTNAIVYNLDGSIHKIIETPMVTNPLEMNEKIKGYSFYSVGWKLNSQKKIILALYIQEVNKPWWDDWVEVWEFDPKTGEFVEFLYRSKY